MIIHDRTPAVEKFSFENYNKLCVFFQIIACKPPQDCKEDSMGQKIFVFVLVVFLIAPCGASYGEIFYRWVDKDGNVHITNSEKDIPKDDSITLKEPIFMPKKQTESYPGSDQPESRETQRSRPQPANTVNGDFSPGDLDSGDRAAGQRDRKDEQIRKELEKAEAVLEHLEQSGYKYVQPELVPKFFSEEDLKSLSLHGMFEGQPQIQTIEALYYFRTKVETLRDALDNY